MWIKRDRYDQLVRAEVTADFLRVRVNQLEQEAGTLKFQLTGIPQAVPQITKTEAPAVSHARRVGNKPVTPPNSVVDAFDSGMGLDFEDMGDDEAQVQGVAVDDDGRVRL